ncbi:MAG: hypothetical protein EZS28_023259 [Streblomastix strix]|uniref:Uncharacterized protein n=1 Tax=Streblomastix strix TaxID=222440 RepID=A0A5J4VFN2_9EUKA|nr:MAG: hypothetical protein EZS28_023259 [Streblomastix strix]
MASICIHLRQNQEAIDAAKLTQKIEVMREEELPEVLMYYVEIGYFDEMIALMKYAVGKNSHKGIQTELESLYSNFSEEKFFENIILFHKHNPSQTPVYLHPPAEPMSSQLVYWTTRTPVWAQPEKIISLMSQEKEKDNLRLDHQSQRQPHPFEIEIIEDIKPLSDAERRGIFADWKFSDTSLEVGTHEYPEKLALLKAYVINKHNRAIDLRDQHPQPNEIFMQTLPGALISLNIPQVQWQDLIKRQLQNNLANQILEALPEKVEKKKRRRHEGSDGDSESESGEQQHHKRSKNKKHRKCQRQCTKNLEAMIFRMNLPSYVPAK